MYTAAPIARRRAEIWNSNAVAVVNHAIAVRNVSETIGSSTKWHATPLRLLNRTYSARYSSWNLNIKPFWLSRSRDMSKIEYIRQLRYIHYSLSAFLLLRTWYSIPTYKKYLGGSDRKRLTPHVLLFASGTYVHHCNTTKIYYVSVNEGNQTLSLLLSSTPVDRQQQSHFTKLNFLTAKSFSFLFKKWKR